MSLHAKEEVAVAVLSPFFLKILRRDEFISGVKNLFAHFRYRAKQKPIISNELDLQNVSANSSCNNLRFDHENLSFDCDCISIPGIDDLEGMDGVVKSDFDKVKLNSGIDIVSFLAEANIFPSKGEARKTIQGGGVSINRKKVNDAQMSIDNSLLLHNQYILVQKGRKNYYLVKLV